VIYASTQAGREAQYRARIIVIASRGDLLTGHTSPETAYLVADYPYGFRLRCQMRYWLEYKQGHGFRLVSQTSNPKRPGLVWNKPKASTYSDCAVMIRDDEGHIHLHTLSPGGWSEWTTVETYETHYAPALTDAHRATIRFIRATIKAGEVLTYTVTTTSDEPRQSQEGQAAIYRKALAYGYAQTRLVDAACDAEDAIDIDELEAYADECRAADAA
jgi:hypothetical protein